MTEGGAGMTEREWQTWRKESGRHGGSVDALQRSAGGCSAAGGHSGHLTPHLTSPLPGGRDELGEGWVLGWVSSCLRRNDGGGRRNGGKRVASMAEREWQAWRKCGCAPRSAGGRSAAGGRSGLRTSHLTSPLKGGRDELGLPLVRGWGDELASPWSEGKMNWDSPWSEGRMNWDSLWSGGGMDWGSTWSGGGRRDLSWGGGT